MSSRPELKIDWCSHAAAKYAVEHWHYSKRMPTGKAAHVGVWEGGVFIGVVLFSWGANHNIGAPYGLAQTQVAELVRVALTSHQWPVSRIVAIAVKFVQEHSPGVRMLVSYADANEGHHGGIYQAMNWVYVGKSNSRPKYISPQGKVLHGREVSVTGINPAFGLRRQTTKIADCKKVRQDGKHKYLMPLDDEMRRQIEPLRKPYPKRVRSVDSDTPASQPESGGAIPTRTLSESKA
jgi:hypothetical protein